jgi:hypothetical protein
MAAQIVFADVSRVHLIIYFSFSITLTLESKNKNIHEEKNCKRISDLII